MDLKSIFKSLQVTAISTVFLFSSSAAFAGKKLNSEELKSLLVGNFMKVVYIYDGKGVGMWEYYQKDGTVAGSTDKWGDFSATYKINDKGEICLTYSSDAYSGCYSYMKKSDGNYKLVNLPWPENTSVDVTVISSATKNINTN